MMDDEDKKRTTRTIRQEDDGEDKIFSEDLPFAPPPRMKTLPPSWLRHRGPLKGTNDITVQGM